MLGERWINGNKKTVAGGRRGDNGSWKGWSRKVIKNEKVTAISSKSIKNYFNEAWKLIINQEEEVIP